MNPFWEKYRDPRWQRRRLEKFQQSNYMCEHCRATEATLHVHHKIYRRGAEPWDYELHELELLCESCHEEQHDLKKSLQDAIAILDQYAFQSLLGFAQALALKQECEGTIRTISPMHTDGISAAFAADNPQEVLDLPKREDYSIDLESLWQLYERRRDRRDG